MKSWDAGKKMTTTMESAPCEAKANANLLLSKHSDAKKKQAQAWTRQWVHMLHMGGHDQMHPYSTQRAELCGPKWDSPCPDPQDS